MRVQALTLLLSKLRTQGEAAFSSKSRWLVREPSPWQPPELDVRATMPILPSVSLSAGNESLAIELMPSASRALITLGRAESNDVVLNDGTLSKRHLHFTPADAAWTVTDAGSYNGTFLDGVKLDSHQPYPLRDGSLLKAGQVELTFHDAAGLILRLRTTEGRPRGTSASKQR
jgi:hypothetical protein